MMIGNSEIKVNETGTVELHQRHRTALEQSDNAFLRVRVTDQLYIDQLLLTKKIDIQHHMTAEWILDQATRANIFVKTPSMDGTFGGGKGDKYTNGLLVFSQTMRRIKKKFGNTGEKLAFDIIVDDVNIKDEKALRVFRKILDYLK
jgi:hypothetical protein